MRRPKHRHKGTEYDGERDNTNDGVIQKNRLLFSEFENRHCGGTITKAPSNGAKRSLLFLDATSGSFVTQPIKEGILGQFLFPKRDNGVTHWGGFYF